MDRIGRVLDEKNVDQNIDGCPISVFGISSA